MDMVVEAPALPARVRFDAAAYHRMGEAGILAEDARVELIDGDVIQMAPIGDDHASTTRRLNEALVVRLRGQAIVSPGEPVKVDRYNEPQPDFSVLRPRDDFYRSGGPRPADVLLVIEVSDTSLSFDRGPKAAMYARAGIAELWIVDLAEATIEVRRDPGPDGYASQTVHRAGDALRPLALPDVVLPVSDLLG